MAHRDGRPNRCIAEEWFLPKMGNPCKCERDDCPTLLRTFDDCQDVVSRWPQDPTAKVAQTMPTQSGAVMNKNGQGGTWDLKYTEADFDHCTDPRRTPTWMEWLNCIDWSAGTCFEPGTEEHGQRMRVLPSLRAHQAGASPGEPLPVSVRTILAELQGKMPPNCSDTMLVGYFRLLKNENASAVVGSEAASQGQRGYVNYFHTQVHAKLGLDFADVTTSPNDAVVFVGYHNDIDRSNLHWMHAARHRLGGARKWSYPSSQSPSAAEAIAGPKPYGVSGPYSPVATKCGPSEDSDEYTGETPWKPGTLWGDVVNAGFPFYDLFESYDGGAHGYTHGDVLTLTAPDRTPYTYDTLEHLYY